MRRAKTEEGHFAIFNGTTGTGMCTEQSDLRSELKGQVA
jgi:hypothetical protein